MHAFRLTSFDVKFNKKFMFFVLEKFSQKLLCLHVLKYREILASTKVSALSYCKKGVTSILRAAFFFRYFEFSLDYFKGN